MATNKYSEWQNISNVVHGIVAPHGFKIVTWALCKFTLIENEGVNFYLTFSNMEISPGIMNVQRVHFSKLPEILFDWLIVQRVIT